MYGTLSRACLEAATALFDFTRCVKPDGTIYGTRGKCRQGTEIGAKETAAKSPSSKATKTSGPASGRIRIGKSVSQYSVKELEKLLKDPRLKPHQVKTVKYILDSKKGKPGSLAERMAAASQKLEEPKQSRRQSAVSSVDSPKPKAGKEGKPQPSTQDGKTTAAKVAAQGKRMAQSQAKPKKPKETPEEKAEKKWLAQSEKVNQIQAQHDKIKSDLEKKGVKVYATGKGADAMNRILKESGIPTESQLSRMRVNLRATEPERLKQERLAKERERIAAEIAGTSREERKGMIRKELERLKGDKYVRSLGDVNRSVDMMQKWIDEDPSVVTLKNRVALTAMRALRAQMVREARIEREGKFKGLGLALTESPKYKETPGSRQPMKLEELLGSHSGGRVDLSKIYEAQGFNAKPELVRSRADLENRKDILREPDGRALVLYRGVTEEGYSRQFQGSGPDGDKHFPGRGVYGNGTYAASAGGNVRESTWIKDGNYDQTAQRTAISFAAGGQGAGNRVTAFALRSDANVVQFEGDTTSQRDNKYYEWVKEITRQAKEKFGIDFNDHGEAAAAMGIHAYRVPMSDSEDYWVILNRGAVIAAQDPQLLY